jgi:hypothetical protein
MGIGENLKILFLFKIIFLCFLIVLNMLILKIIFLKKYYFNIFLNKKHFKKQLIQYLQIS